MSKDIKNIIIITVISSVTVFGLFHFTSSMLPYSILVANWLESYDAVISIGLVIMLIVWIYQHVFVD